MPFLFPPSEPIAAQFVGLGHAIFQAGSLYAIPKIFASLAGALTLALALTFVVGRIGQLLIPWRRAG